MRRALHAELTKLRTVPGPGWLLLAVIMLTVALSTAASAFMTCPPTGCDHDVAELGLSGIRLGQGAVAVLAVLVIGGEYGTGMIRTTFTAMPRRMSVLGAKAILLAALTVVSGTIAVLASVFAGRLLLPGNGFTPENGHPLLSLTDGPMLRAAVGSVLYLVLIALLSLGIGAAVRDAATAIGIVLTLLYLVPVIILMLRDPDMQDRLWQLSPASAGLAIQVTNPLPDLPLSPWEGFAVLAAWTTAALVTGALLLRHRDA